MKQLLSFFIALVFLFGLISCGGNAQNNTGKDSIGLRLKVVVLMMMPVFPVSLMEKNFQEKELIKISMPHFILPEKIKAR